MTLLFDAAQLVQEAHLAAAQQVTAQQVVAQQVAQQV